MKRISSIFTLFFQIFTTFVTLFIIYIIFALLDMDEIDMITEGAFIIFQPIFAIIFSSLTIIACFIIGLPIRLLPKLKLWWANRPVFIFAALIIAAVLLLLSLNSNFTESTNITIGGEERTKEIPNYTLALSGWFLTAFSLLHFYQLTFLYLVKTNIMRRGVNRNASRLV